MIEVPMATAPAAADLSEVLSMGARPRATAVLARHALGDPGADSGWGLTAMLAACGY